MGSAVEFEAGDGADEAATEVKVFADCDVDVGVAVAVVFNVVWLSLLESVLGSVLVLSLAVVVELCAVCALVVGFAASTDAALSLFC